MARLKVSDDEYDLLTEEERIGLKEYQAEIEAAQAEEDAEIAAAAAGDPEEPAPSAPEPPDEEEPPEEEEADEPPAEDEEEPPAEEEPEAEEAGEDDAEEDGEAADEPPVVAQTVSSPIARLTDVEETRLVSIKKQLKELAQKFDDGELTAVEWRDQQEVLEDERDALKEKRAIAAMSTQTAVNTWYFSTIPLFMAQHTEYKEGSLRHKLLDTIVREKQTASSNPTDPKILVEAHNQIIKELGEVNGVAKPVKKASGNGRKREVPPNFSAIPASDQTQVVTPNKFARLDKLKGVDYERALAKLNPADREFYLQGGG